MVLSQMEVVFPAFSGVYFRLQMVDILKPMYYMTSFTKPGLRQRKDADKILKNNLIQNGMSKIGAYCVYFSVRLFGGKFYHEFCK